MKTLSAFSLFVFSLAFGLPAPAAEVPSAPLPAMAAGAEAAWTEATVKKVDPAAGKVTLTHGPLENLGMPGMTMIFRVKEASWLDTMKPGDRIRFIADKINGAFTVIEFEAAGQ